MMSELVEDGRKMLKKAQIEVEASKPDWLAEWELQKRQERKQGRRSAARS